ncbi:hypothetical protein KDL29_05550 [bacterium]|nr:hypothetical protein [bacterium]
MNTAARILAVQQAAGRRVALVISILMGLLVCILLMFIATSIMKNTTGFTLRELPWMLGGWILLSALLGWRIFGWSRSLLPRAGSMLQESPATGELAAGVYLDRQEVQVSSFGRQVPITLPGVRGIRERGLPLHHALNRQSSQCDMLVGSLVPRQPLWGWMLALLFSLLVLAGKQLPARLPDLDLHALQVIANPLMSMLLLFVLLVLPVVIRQQVWREALCSELGDRLRS